MKYLCWIPEYGHTVDDGKEVEAFDADHYTRRKSRDE